MTTRSRRTPIPLLLISLSLLAWVVLGIWGLSPHSRFLSHEGLRPTDFSNARSVLTILTGWLLMIVAVMLPTSLPLLAIFARITRRRTDHTVLLCLLIAGYLLIWTFFGIVAVFVDGLLHQALDQWLWLKQHDWPIGASLFAVAGLYQFTTPKSYCLDKCRSPMRFLTVYWQRRHDRYQTLQLGVRHGLLSLGCSWSLMLLIFGIGMINLGWLLVFGTIMAIEKNVPWGRQFRAPVGFLMLFCGLATVLEATLIAW